MKQKQVLKASTAAILAFSALQPVMSVEASQTITDVKKSSKYYEGVKFLSANKAFQGSKYYPEKNLTQEAAVQMLSTVWKVKAAKAQKGVFTNVPKTSKLFPVLHGMVARGILEKSKTFDGKKLIKRSELLVWSQRAFRLTPTAVQPYQDVSLSSDTGKAASALNAFDFLSDIYPDTKLNPEKVVKRDEFAQWSHLLSKRQPVTMSVERTTDRTVVINGLTYTFDQKWKKLFQSPAIKKANIVFTADKGKIKSIEQITIQQGGKSSAPYILDGGNVQLPRLIVKTNYVKVQNLEIKQLDVLEQAKKGVTFDHVNVTGKVQVQSSPSAKKQQLASPVVKDKASIMSQSTPQRRTVDNVEVIKSYDGARVLFIDSDVEELIVTHPNTSVIVSKGATIKKVVLSANARIETNQGAVIEQLLVKRGTLYAEVAGTIQNCQVEAPVELEIVKDAVIQNLSTAEEATIQGAGKIDQMQIKDGSKSLELNVAVRQMEVLTSQSIELLGKPNIGSLKIGEQATSVSLKIESNIPEVVIASKTVKMDVGTGVQITSLQIPSGSNAADLITNYDKVEDQIKNPPVITPPVITPPTPPTDGGTTTPPTSGEGTPPVVTPPQEKISDELDQVLDMKGDSYAVFDLTEELLKKLVESKEIETFEANLLDEYRLYIKSMHAEDLENAQDLRRVLKKVKEVHDVRPTSEESFIYTPSPANWGVQQWYRLSIEETDNVRIYFKRDGKLVNMESLTEDDNYVNFGDFEKIENGYRMHSFYHYDEIIFEKKDGSFSHLTMDKVKKDGEGKVYFSNFNGKDIELPVKIYEGEINKLNPEEDKYHFLDFDHFVYYEIPNVENAVDVGHAAGIISNGIHHVYTTTGVKGEKGTAIIGILKSLHQNGSFELNFLIPGYAATPFESKFDLEEEKDKPFQFIITDDNRNEFLKFLHLSLDEKNVSYPIRLETIDGKPVEMKDVTITKLPNEEREEDQADDKLEAKTVRIENGELKIDLNRSGQETYLIQAGEMKQTLWISVSETFDSKAINVSKVKSKEEALELIRRAILLREIESLPIELFQKISPNYVEEGMTIYKHLLYDVLRNPEGGLEPFIEKSDFLNNKLALLLEPERKFEWTPLSVELVEEQKVLQIKLQGDNNERVLMKKPNKQFEEQSGLRFNIQKKDNGYFVNRYHSNTEKSGSYVFYPIDANAQPYERLTIELGKAADNMIEVLKINEMTVDEFISTHANQSNEQEEPPSDGGTDTSEGENSSSDEQTSTPEEGADGGNDSETVPDETEAEITTD